VGHRVLVSVRCVFWLASFSLLLYQPRKPAESHTIHTIRLSSAICLTTFRLPPQTHQREFFPLQALVFLFVYCVTSRQSLPCFLWKTLKTFCLRALYISALSPSLHPLCFLLFNVLFYFIFSFPLLSHYCFIPPQNFSSLLPSFPLP
jgi:hypothetical protein